MGLDMDNWGDELIAVLKKAIDHLEEKKPWINSISVSNYSPTIIKINFNENQKVRFGGQIGTIQGIGYSRRRHGGGRVTYSFVADDKFKTLFLVDADEIEACE